MKIKSTIQTLRTSKKSLLGLFSIFVFSLIFFPYSSAHAGWWDAILGSAAGSLLALPNILLFVVFQFIGFLTALGVSVIGLALDSTVISTVLGSDAVSTGWGIVRDLFNVLFIFTLLFSAFATIFQVEKYHLKRTLLTVIIMALLINFSWPLTRIIIDIANVIMFYFLNGLTGENLFAIFADVINLDKIYVSGSVELAGQNTLAILISVTFSFIFMITIWAVTLILLVRTVALAILLIFAPIGFAGAAIPGMQGLSSQWWSSLIKYAMSGPVIIFFMMLATAIQQELVGDKSPFKSIATAKSAQGASFGSEQIAAISTFIIPIIILWFSIIVTGKIGVAGSSFVTSKANDALRSGRRLAVGATRSYARSLDQGFTGSRVEGTAVAAKQSIMNIGKKFADSSARSRDGAVARELTQTKGFLGGDKHAVKNHENRTVATIKKEARDNDLSVGAKLDGAKSKDPLKARAMRELLAETKDSVKQPGDFAASLSAMGANSEQAQNLIRTAAHEDSFKNLDADQYKDVVSQIKRTKFRDSDNNVVDKTKQEEIQKSIKKDLDKRIAKAGKADTLYTHKIKVEGMDQTKAVEEVYSKLGADDMSKQDDTFDLAVKNDQFKQLLIDELGVARQQEAVKRGGSKAKLALS